MGMRGRRPLHQRWGITVRLSLISCLLVCFVLLVAGLSLANPAVDATLTDTPSMNPVGPGDTIDYEALISNSGDMPATGVTFDDQSDGNNTTSARCGPHRCVETIASRPAPIPS